jgi:hypothetical protein
VRLCHPYRPAASACAQALRLSGLNLASRPSTSNVDSSSSHVATSSDSSSNSTCSSSDSACSYGQAQRHIEATLPDASYEPAAVAVLAGMYMVKPWPELLSDLTTQQQVHAAVLADMWQLPAASDAALQLLKTAADTGSSPDSTDGVSGVLQALFSMAALPGCLMPLLEEALLGRYGNLEAVWNSQRSALQDSLLQLPLHAMELLLASDQLKVSLQSVRNPGLRLLPCCMQCVHTYVPTRLPGSFQQWLFHNMYCPAGQSYTAEACGKTLCQAAWNSGCFTTCTTQYCPKACGKAQHSKQLTDCKPRSLGSTLLLTILLLCMFSGGTGDTVLYTAQAYVKSRAAAGSSDEAQRAADSLVPLIRCSHLSQF